MGASVEAVVEDIPDQSKDIRQLVTSMPTITVLKALALELHEPWDGLFICTHSESPRLVPCHQSLS
jgi:hypothetical protein